MKRLDESTIKIIAKQRLAQTKRKKLAKPPVSLPPDQLGRSYYREIKQMNDYLNRLINEIVVDNLEVIQALANEGRPTTDSQRNDGFIDYIESLFKRIQVKFTEKYTFNEYKNIALRQGRKIDEFSYRQFNRQFNKVLGVNPIANDSFLKNSMEMFTQTNVELIKSIPETKLSDVKKIIQVNAQKGSLAKDTAKAIKKRFGVSDSKARFIARDQTAKFNSELTKNRQQAVGIKSYIWQTSGDERVRPMHEALDGQVIQWDDPPVTSDNGDKNHAGMDYNCITEDSLVKFISPAKSAFKRFYTGDVVEITNEASVSVSITPNHPVLTLRGWVAAKELNQSDNLIECLNPEVLNIINTQINNDTFSPKNIHDFLKIRFSCERTAGIDVQFHSDGRVDEEIEVIHAPSGLTDDVAEASFNQMIVKNIFPNSNFATSSLPSSSDFEFMLNCRAFSDCAFVRFPNLVKPLSNSHSRPLEFLSFRLRPDFYTILNKSFSDDVSTGFELLSNLILTYARSVKLADLCDIEFFSIPNLPILFKSISDFRITHKKYSGYVYNYSTTNEAYLSGNIILHNCRCVAIPNIQELLD